MGVRCGAAEEPQLGAPVRRDAELPGLGSRDERRARSSAGTSGRCSTGGGSTDGRCKVLIIGQEGAQDESLSPPLVHRRHRRSDAARPEPPRHHPLVPVPEHVRVPDLRPVQRAAADARPGPRLADRAASQRALDYVLARNDLRLVIAVGAAAKESVATWIEAHGGSAGSGRSCTRPTRIGSAPGQDGRRPAPGRSREGWRRRPRSSPTSSERSVSSSSGAATIRAGSRSIPGRPASPADAYTYSCDADPVPGLPVRHELAAGSRQHVEQPRPTTRRRSSCSPKGGEYGDTSATYATPPGSTTPDSSYVPAPGDLPYEPARTTYLDFDRRPDGDAWPGCCRAASPGRPWPDFAGLGLSANPSLGHGPGLPGPPRPPLDPGAGRPGVAGRPVHRSGADGRRRPAPAGVPAVRGGDEAVRHPANAAGRLTR